MQIIMSLLFRKTVHNEYTDAIDTHKMHAPASPFTVGGTKHLATSAVLDYLSHATVRQNMISSTYPQGLSGAACYIVREHTGRAEDVARDGLGVWRQVQGSEAIFAELVAGSYKILKSNVNSHYSYCIF
jgi:hypothetical protein